MNMGRQDSLTETLTLKQLLHEVQYVIPLYQRNFAWEDRQVEQLLRDIEENNNEQYYIGTLVVAEGEKAGKPYFEVIDGQQRLTVVNIIYSVLSKKVGRKESCATNLSYECREKSNYALRRLRETGNLDYVEGAGDESFRLAIRTIDRFVKEVLGDDGGRVERYLEDKFLKVCIFRVKLHERTDKNHYFEVMNNRGEQLEAHEIVKAKLMYSLDNAEEREVFATVWDACSDMNGRLENNRAMKPLWGERFEDDPLSLDSFDKIAAKVGRGCQEDNPKPFTLASIVDFKRTKENPQQETQQDMLDEQYYSVIDFPNFLLQVLEIGQFKKGVRMDAGKFLLYEFGCVGEKRLPDAKEFLVKLLRLRILFDKFIIKRKRTDKTVRGWKWAIERPEYKNGRQYVVNTFDTNPVDSDEVDDASETPGASKPMCMLQAMFFVTFRRDVYMRWLTKALVAVNEKPDGSTLMETLQDYSVSFIRESRSSDGVATDEYKKGQAIHHYVFNFLDYQLWYLYYSKVTGQKNLDLDTYADIVAMLDRKGVRVGFQYFIFTRRNSVEHYLAQEKGRFRGISDTIINDFGNLSLISGGLNSKLSNRECEEKKEYHDSRNPSSLKYELMMSELVWNEETIKKHGKLMADLLVGKSDGYFEAYETEGVWGQESPEETANDESLT